MAEVNCSARGTAEPYAAHCEKDKMCQIVHSESKTGTTYIKCAPTAAAIPGFTHEPKWIGEEGKLTGIFEKALGRSFPKGMLVDSMSEANCRKVGAWMADNVKKWNEPGKNPKTEGRMMIAVLSRRTDTPKERVRMIANCASIVGEALSKIPETKRK